MPRKRVYKNDAERQRAFRYKNNGTPFIIVDEMVIPDGKDVIHRTQKSTPKHNNDNVIVRSNGNNINIKIDGLIKWDFSYQKFEKYIKSKAIKKRNNIMAIGGIHLRQSDMKSIYLLIELLKEEGILG